MSERTNPNEDGRVRARHQIRKLKGLIDQGRRGEAVSIPFVSYPRLSEHIDIGQSEYYMVGGAPGTGKTAFAHQTFVLDPYVWYLKNKDNTNVKLRIKIRGMERPSHYIIGKWACFRLWVKYGILLDYKTLIGRRARSRMTEEVYELAMESIDYFEQMLDSGIVEYISGADNPTGFRNHIIRYAESVGRIVKVDEYVKYYEPSDPNLITIYLLDHIGLIKGERGYDERGNLAKMSEYLREARDVFGISPVVVTQFNRGIESFDRRDKLEPQSSDFKGASNMYEDADNVMALFNPYKYKVPVYPAQGGYKVSRLVSQSGENRFRALTMLKSSYGIDDFYVGLHFMGEVGRFVELPLPGQIRDADYPRLCNPQHYRKAA